VGQALSDVSAQPACSGGEYAWIVTAGPPATCTTRWMSDGSNVNDSPLR
jgi:hypothetical protein